MSFNSVVNNILNESLDIGSIKKSETKSKHRDGDVRKSYEFVYDGMGYSYAVTILGLESAKQMAKVTNNSPLDFIGKSKDDVFNDLSGVLYWDSGNTSWQRWRPASLHAVPEEIIQQVKDIADLKQNLTPQTRETFGDLYDEL